MQFDYRFFSFIHFFKVFLRFGLISHIKLSSIQVSSLTTKSKTLTNHGYRHSVIFWSDMGWRLEIYDGAQNERHPNVSVSPRFTCQLWARVRHPHAQGDSSGMDLALSLSIARRHQEASRPVDDVGFDIYHVSRLLRRVPVWTGWGRHSRSIAPRVELTTS